MNFCHAADISPKYNIGKTLALVTGHTKILYCDRRSAVDYKKAGDDRSSPALLLPILFYVEYISQLHTEYVSDDCRPAAANVLRHADPSVGYLVRACPPRKLLHSLDNLIDARRADGMAATL